LTPSTTASHSAVLWQGYHHAWEYNHRINRLGSYVDHGPDGAVRATVGHTAASGTGNDTAHFTDFCTTIQSAEGVAFQAGCAETVVECQRGDLTPFTIEVDGLELAPEMQGRHVYAVVLNGFDIYALEHAEKIITFDVDLTEPTVYEGGTKARFYVVGRLCFDCRSPECQLLPLRLESEPVGGQDEETGGDGPGDGDVPELPPVRQKRGLDRRKFDRAANWIKRQLAMLMGVDEIKRSLVGDDADSTRRRLFRFFGRRFYLRFLKWELSAPYKIRVRFLLIGGDRDALRVSDSDYFSHEYSWDLENEIHHEQVGVLPVTVGADDVEAYAVNTLAFSRMSMDVEIDKEQGTEDFVQWGRGMHFLEWSMAIRDIEPGPNGVRAMLDLFYKNWSEAMNRVITITTWGAVRGAGSARIGARFKLLQLNRATTAGQIAMPGRIYWPGGGLSAVDDPRARFERPVGALAEET
jgi:hypothetical protein